MNKTKCSSKSVIACFFSVCYIDYVWTWLISWFNVLKPSNKVGVDVSEYNVFDNVDVDRESAVKIVIILYENNFNK